MNAVDRIRMSAAQMLDYIRGEQMHQYQREQSQPNGLIRQMDDPDRQLQDQQARVQQQLQREQQEQAQRAAAQQGDL